MCEVPSCGSSILPQKLFRFTDNYPNTQGYSTIYPNSSFSNIATIVFVGLLFIVSGNYFPKNHVNKYIGLKFPWLLNDEESWDKTHKLASYTWILAGIIFILQLFVSPLKVVSIPLVIILVGVLPLIYSLMLVYKNKRR